MVYLGGLFCPSIKMLVTLLFLMAVPVLAMSLLTAFRVPVIVNWKLAMLAGEFCYWFLLLSLGMAAVIWVNHREGPAWAMAGLTVCGLATLFFMKPVIEAWLVSRKLPDRLEKAFGPARLAELSFSLRGFLRKKPPAGSFQTHNFSPGLQLNLYLPPDSKGPVPCVLVIHGGGWDGGNRSELSGFNDWLVAQGYAVAAVDYRLAPAHPWPAQREDVLAAIAWLKSHANEMLVDADRLVLLGRSAGGQIASAVGYAEGDPAIRGVIALYAPHDMPFAWSVSREDDALNSIKLMSQYMGGPPDQGRNEIYHTASAQLNVTPDSTPPTLLLHGAIDTLVWRRHSERLATRLHEAGRPHVLVEFPWATHAFEYNLSGPSGQLTTYSVRWFLDAVTHA
jgi:acetyl esterase/lipase